MKSVCLLLVTNFVSLLAAEYQPIRYERFIAQSKAALEAQRKMIEQKLPNLIAHREGAMQPKAGSVRPRTLPGAQTIIESSGATIDTLQSRLSAIQNRIKGLETLKKELPQMNIQNSKEETQLIRKAAAQQTIADITQQLNDIKQTQQLIERLPASQVDLKTVAELRERWRADRMNLETRLQREIGYAAQR